MALASTQYHHHHHHHHRNQRIQRSHTRPSIHRLSLAKRRHGYPNWWTPAFPPTHESLLAQNAEIDRLGLPRIKNDQELKKLIQNGELVPIPVGDHLIVDSHLPKIRRYCRPWTAQFLTDLSNAFYEKFHDPIMVDSAVRTIEVQNRLRRWNGNAAPSEGDTASSHLAGLTVDLSRRRMTPEQSRWVEQWLMPLHAMKLVEVEEEYHQFCFHIMVYGDYSKLSYPVEITPEIMGLTTSLKK